MQEITANHYWKNEKEGLVGRSRYFGSATLIVLLVHLLRAIISPCSYYQINVFPIFQLLLLCTLLRTRMTSAQFCVRSLFPKLCFLICPEESPVQKDSRNPIDKGLGGVHIVSVKRLLWKHFFLHLFIDTHFVDTTAFRGHMLLRRFVNNIFYFRNCNSMKLVYINIAPLSFPSLHP